MQEPGNREPTSIRRYAKPVAKLRTVLPPFLLLGLNLTLFGTLAIYVGNVGEFDHDYLSLSGPILWALLIFLVSGLALALAISQTAGRKISAVVLALGILTWIQGNILLRDYGLLDARGLDLKPLSFWGWFDLVLWGGVVTGFWFYSRIVVRQALFVSLLLIGIQSAYSIFEVLETGERLWIKEELNPTIPEEILEYSESRNVIHVLLDGFQTDVFVEIVERDSLENAFDGFWLFFENAAVSQITTLSLPAVFSGEIYDGTRPPEDYYNNVISSRSFPNILYEAGYVVNLVPMLEMEGGRYTNRYTIPSLYGESGLAMASFESGRLLDYSLFRQAPHFLKGLVYNENNWLIGSVTEHASRPSYGQKLFFQDYTERITSSLKVPAYHFVHLLPPHPPYITTPSGEYAGRVLPNNRANCLTEARSMIELLLALFERLRDLGIYDSSLILIHGDHGSNLPPLIDGKEVPMRLARIPTLLTVKPPGGKGPLKVSRVETSVADIAATVLTLLDIQHDLSGEPVFSLEQGRRRVREFFLYATADGESRVERYLIEGSIFDRDSWTDGPVRRVVKDRPLYSWGDEIRFGIEGNSGPYQGDGWSSPFRRVTWNNGDRASLRFLVRPARQGVRLDMRFIPCIYPEKHTLQRVRVSVNGVRLTEWRTDEKKPYLFSVTLPAEIMDVPEVLINLEFPDAVRPASIGAGGDRRKLAIALGMIRMSLVGEQ